MMLVRARSTHTSRSGAGAPRSSGTSETPCMSLGTGTPKSDKIVGAIGMADCRFVRCRFAQVAFTGDDALLAELESGITAGNSAMEKAGGGAA